MPIRLIKPWTWFWGLLSGFISGGAAALTSGPIAALFAPSEFNLHEGFSKLLYFMLTIFLQAGLVNAMFYLVRSPVPHLIEDDTAHINKGDV
jgi:hypothetical protein